MAEKREPHDGRPFYCDVCGAGYYEFLACEQADCRLETMHAAVGRKAREVMDKYLGDRGQ
jgi:hypothetical protein